MIEPIDRVYMARAINLAKQGVYTTMPNPRVGCVLVKDGKVVGEGWHQKAGEGHAEINALNVAGDAARGATAYVTLEPCSHVGKTGPCCQALIEAGVSKVVFGMEDPNPKVAGRGLEALEAAGVEVLGEVLEEQARELNPGFIKRMQSGRPYIRCKMAMSFDGRTAMKSGESKWVTGPAARADVQRLRARSCAIVTGIGSILHDDSSLTVRENELNIENPQAAAAIQPLRVVLDSQQRLTASAKVIQSPARTLVVSTQPEPDSGIALSGVEQICLPAREDRVNPLALVQELAKRECNEVLLETGATLAGAFLRLGLVDELVVYMSPKLMGSNARPLFELPLNTMSAQLPLIITDVRAVGVDWRFTAKPDPEA